MAETYQDLLFELQQHEDTPLLVHLFPDEDEIHMIDWETRTIEVSQFLSVRFDHNSELVYFGTPRYFEGMDLADMVCVIQYINPAQEKGLYFVPYYDIDHTDENGTPLLVIPWVLGGLATIKSGKITFNIRFYKINYRTK